MNNKKHGIKVYGFIKNLAKQYHLELANFAEIVLSSSRRSRSRATNS